MEIEEQTIRNSNSTATTKNKINVAMPAGVVHFIIRLLHPVCSEVAKPFYTTVIQKLKLIH
jgi:hypothetical protein